MRTNCDLSIGHSGSPLFDVDAWGREWVYGVMIVERCTTCKSPEDPGAVYAEWPNVFRRITPAMINQLNFWEGFESW